jgi:Tfp pilus assembly PilM family ATPase
MSEKVIPEIAVVGIDIGKTSFHVVGLNRRGAVIELFELDLTIDNQIQAGLT